jgi:hypothetical protein
MFDHARALEIIERAIHDAPYCPVCGAPTDVREDEVGRLWLVCTADVPADGLLARLRSALEAHVRRPVLDLEELAA